MHLTKLLLAAGLILPLGACATAKTCDPGGNMSPAVPAPNPTGLGMRLLDPGSEPRAPLRYAYAEGADERSRLELVVGTSVASADGAGEGLLPPVGLDVAAGPVEMRPEGRFRYGLRVVGVELMATDVDPEAAAAAEQELEALKGLGGWMEVDERGVLRDRAIHIPDDVPRELALMLGNVRTALMSVPFPEEPVGPGARWQTERDVELSGLRGRQTVTYTLRQVDARGGSLEVVMHTTAPPQNIEGGRLHGYETSGMGTVNFLFERLTPLSEADITNQMRATAEEGGASAPVQIRTRTMLRLYNLNRRLDPKSEPEPEPKAKPEPAPDATSEPEE